MKIKHGASVFHLNGVFSGSRNAGTSSLKYHQSFGPEDDERENAQRSLDREKGKTDGQ